MRITLPLCLLSFSSLATAQWTQYSAANSPSPRIEPQMAFDGSRNQTVLFGGADTTGFPPRNFAATWIWDGLAWTQAAPAASPAGRYFGGMAHDGVRGRTVLYGGLVATFSGANYRDDTWEWDGSSWAQVVTAHSPGGYIGSNGVGEVSMAYDLIGQRIILFGGELFQGIVPAPPMTLFFDGTDWGQASPPVQPPQRSQASMCSAPLLGGVLLFGGTNFNNPPGPNGEQLWNDLWVYSSLTDTWTRINPAGPLPPARADASLLFDSRAGVYVLHGGYEYVNNSISPLADTWVFDGTAWIDVTASYGGPAGPHVRFAAAEAPGGCHVMFGGSTSVFGTLTNETWIQGCAARAVPFGSGCTGSWGVPSLTANGLPSFGGSFDVVAGNLDPAGAFAFLTFGVSSTMSPFGPLPVNLQPFGLGAGCQLLVSADFTVLVPNASGTATFPFTAPATIAIAGLGLYFQSGSMDAGAPGTVAVSNGLGCAIGY
jgi:hypothetical protein